MSDSVHVDVIGPTMLTHSGRFVHPFAIEPTDVDIDDIAVALSRINRYLGHTKYPYSVAQHCVIVSRLVPRWAAWAGLMHDAPEAYLGDVIAPIKMMLDARYKRAEDKAWLAICARYHRNPLMPDQVDYIDKRLRHNEMAALMILPSSLVDQARPIRNGEIESWLRELKPDEAAEEFLARFRQLEDDHG